PLSQGVPLSHRTRCNRHLLVMNPDPNAQTLGGKLRRSFTEDDDPVIQFLRVGTPRRSIFRKIKEVGRGDHA
ncbi:hypothetical protein, partial [Aquicoccus porphyridii]|uniref:hypothetical protein n=1 Tax=Aquicoccus porphyridii TaxID=1852029 RepID=UPI00273FD952